MTPKQQTIRLTIAGLGIVLYAPEAVSEIAIGTDYLSSRYLKPADVQTHIQAGTIVGFGTGSPGDFLLNFRVEAPLEEAISAAEFKLRLGLKTSGLVVCRDLYDLLSWQPETPPEQQIQVAAGNYKLTILSSPPKSGILGDNQTIDVFLEIGTSLPRLSNIGIPMLCR
jgi:hypothetical protein